MFYTETTVTPFLVIAAMIVVNALYVAAEFASVAVPRPRVAQAAREGSSRAAGLQEIASEGGIAFAASADGSCLWPDFLPANDASATLAKLLDLLARDGRRCSEIVRGLPTVAMAHVVVPTPWERKGAVMRELVERVPPEQLVLVDGVKIVRDDGWVLVLPDPEDAATHVVAEAGTEADARRAAEEYARRIRQSLR